MTESNHIKVLYILVCIFLTCKQSNEKYFRDLASDIAQKSKAELGKNLMNAIQEKGYIGALEFCNLNAIPITNSLSQKFQVNIKRVSDKPRNPLNSATKDEINIIEKFKSQILNKEILDPVVLGTEKSYVGYFPIETNAMCLQCHGDEEIAKEVSNKIKTLYPEDKAIGYNVNQIRGLWVIEQSK